MKILEVNGLCKSYRDFYLDNVSFSLEQGYIMGFIGSNGAGKTTTLKGIMKMIHTKSGDVNMFGEDFGGNTLSMKQDIAFMLGGSEYYLKRKIKTVSTCVRKFYSNWDEEVYQSYLKRFKLDPEKMIGDLSQGMRVKYSLALALSHKAKLLLLDEPTSGLDPVARDNLLELFQELVESGERSILFSTHITSDLEKCADFITFINNGKIIGSTNKDHFLDSYRLVNGSKADLEEIKTDLVAHKLNSFGFLGLIRTELLDRYPSFNSEVPALDDIMIYFAKREEINA
ncbi:MAG: ABC transporter ATP-binding protein [Spirochaetaceae bacterium]|jgi:ABC-2 type transport system ATP-binding protein|nr:ABC transporter ATP-binding protein [Spirochaetaceae bacterium]